MNYENSSNYVRNKNYYIDSSSWYEMYIVYIKQVGLKVQEGVTVGVQVQVGVKVGLQVKLGGKNRAKSTSGG